MILGPNGTAVVTSLSTCRHDLCVQPARIAVARGLPGVPRRKNQVPSLSQRFCWETRKLKMGRQPRSGDTSLATGPFDPDWDRR